MTAYYNENDPKAVAWLRELIKGGHIADGVVDDRSIRDVTADDINGFTQCHFFAGIGGWSLALRLAGWPDDQPVWTGSCPCQPFSAAGKRRGTSDARHLWPDFCRLIAQCGPAVIFGEQVASKDGRQWLAGVRADLEALGYGVGAADLCAAGTGTPGEGWIVHQGKDTGGGARDDWREAWERIVVGPPHIRQRLFWVANSASKRSFSATQARVHCGEEATGARHGQPERCCDSSGLGNPNIVDESPIARIHGGPGTTSTRVCGMADTDGGDTSEERKQRGGEYRQQSQDGGVIGGGLVDSDSSTKERLRPISVSLEPKQEARRPGYANAWADTELIRCADGKPRRVEPGIHPLAHGIPGRVGLLRGYGNAIVAQVAAEFIQAFVEAKEEIEEPSFKGS